MIHLISISLKKMLSKFEISNHFLIMATTGTLAWRCILLICILCPMMSVLCHPTLSAATPEGSPLSSISLSSTLTPCVIDENCNPGHFCHSRTKSCVSCLVEECEEKWKRLPGSNGCTKSQSECGNCIQGYSAHHGHCQPNSPLSPHISKQSEMDDNENNSTDGSNILVVVLALVAALIILGTVLPLLVYWSRMREHRNFVQSVDKEDVDGEHIAERPPPYNPDMSDDILLFCDENFYTNRASVNRRQDAFDVPPCEMENSTRAFAFDSGNFPTVLPSGESAPLPASPTVAPVVEENPEMNMEVEIPLLDETIQSLEIVLPVENIEASAQSPAQGAQPPESIAQDNQELPLSSHPELSQSPALPPSLRTRSTSGAPSLSHSQSSSPASPVLQPASSSEDSGHFSLFQDQDTDDFPFLHISLHMNVEVWPVVDGLSTLHPAPPVSQSRLRRFDASQTTYDLSTLVDHSRQTPMPDIDAIELDHLYGVVPTRDCPDELMDLSLYQD